MANRANESTATQAVPELSSAIDTPVLTATAGPWSREPEFLDWRAIDPSTIVGDGVPVEELLFFRETLGEMLLHAEGNYVLISGRQRLGYYRSLEEAANVAQRSYRDRTILIKKVAPIEPIHSTGGVVG